MKKGGARKGAGRPKGQKLPPRPDKKELIEIFAAAHRPAKPKENPLVTKWREVFETKNQGLLFDALKYECDQSYGKATQPIDHGGSMDHNIVFDMPGPARERKK